MHHKYVFRATANNATESNYYRRDINIGLYPTGNSDYIVDNWTLTKVAMQSTSYVAPTGVNLFDEWCFNWNYDTAGTSMKNLYGCTNANVIPQFSTYTTNGGTAPTTASATGNGGSGMKITNATSTGYYRANFIPVEDGAKYLATADVKLTSADSDAMKWTLINTKMNTTKISESNLAVNSTGWTTVKYIFSASGTPDSQYSRRDISIGLYSEDGNEFIVDNWTLTKLPAAPSVTNATVVDGKAVFTFDNDVVATASNFTVSPATATVNVTGSGSEYTVELSGYTHSTEYTITTKDITDTYGQALTADSSVKIITPVDADATILTTEDLTHNVAELRGTFADGTFTRGEDESYTDDNTGVRAFNIYVVPGTYVISAKVKQNAADTIENARAWIVAGVSGTNSNCIDVNTLFSRISINKDGWTEISGMVKISENANNWNDADGDLRDDDAATQVIHAGISSEAHIFDITDLQIRKAASLDLDDTYAAVVKADGSNANLYITGPASTVYFAAATYTGSTVTDIQFQKLTLTDNKLSVEELTKGDSYKFFIWDSNFKPLNSTFMGTEF